MPPAVTIQGLSKSYPLFSSPVDRLRQLLRPGAAGANGVAALKSIDLTIKRGQIFGIVGKNGSGKSTLLRLLSGVVPPSSGSLEVTGTVAALLELGAGFDPEFSGRDNVLVSCALLGIDEATALRRLPEIEAFADVGVFFDRPVKTYSSGMYARVAFAALAVCEPDVLILDEILAVGDEAFQRKCLARLETLAASGCTVILVTHNSQLVIEFCDAAALLSDGELRISGSPKDVVHAYYKSQGFALADNAQAANESGETDTSGAASPLPGGGFASALPATPASDPAFYDPNLTSSSTVAYGNGDALIEDVRLLDDQDKRVNVLSRGEAYRLCYRVTLQRDAEEIEFGSLIKTTKGVELGGLALGGTDELRRPVAGTRFDVDIPFVANLLPGTYFVNAGVRGLIDGVPDYLHRLMDASMFRVREEPDSGLRGIVDLSHSDQPVSYVCHPTSASESAS